MLSLAGGLPDASRFPVPELARIAERVITESGGQVLQYGTTQGDEAARRALVRLYDSPTDPESLVVTTGSQQALDLLGRVLLDPGDQVVVHDPDYLGALQVFRSHEAHLIPVAVDGDGLDTSELEDRLRAGARPKACYVVPHFHNPTGATLSPDRRRHLGELAAMYGFVIIEDDPYRDLWFDGTGPTEAVSDPQLTVRLRSTSKTLAPGLRLGVLSAPPWLVRAVVTAKQSTDMHTSRLSQAVVASALEAPWFTPHLEGLRSWYGAKRDVLVGALQEVFADRVHFTAPGGGMFLWVEFTDVDDTGRWLERCLDAGVCFVPGAAFAVERNLVQAARLAFATGSPEQLHRAVARMASCV